MSEVEAKRAANRAAFPAVANIVDDFRAAFGPDVKALGGVDHTTGKTFGDVSFIAEQEACAGCTGESCEHPRRDTVFCGFRRGAETAHAIGLAINASKDRVRR